MSPRSRLRGLARLLIGVLACSPPEPGGAGEASTAATTTVEPAEPAVADASSTADSALVAPDPAALAADPAADLPRTELPLTLLATLAADDPAASTATLRDDETGAIHSVRQGDALFTDVEIAAIGRGYLEILRAGERERLDLPRAGVRLTDHLGLVSESPDADDPGVLQRGVLLGPGPHYVVKNTDHTWGERASVAAIQRAITAYVRKARGGPKVHVGDLSRRGGGYFPPHLSHRSGRDVDVGYVLRGDEADETRFRVADARNLDVARTWELLRAFIDTGHVRIIFVDTSIQRLLYDHAREQGMSPAELDALLQYPRGEGHAGGVIRHFRGHRNHFHVRFGPPLARGG